MTPARRTGSASRGARPRPVAVNREPAGQQPVARIAVDISLAHLDRPFDYMVAESDSAAARPGVRVRVRFAGRLVDGYILERAERSDHVGRLAFLERVISPEVVLTPAIARLARSVADRYAGSMADVLRLAVPPRHGRTEQAADLTAESGPDTDETAAGADTAGAVAASVGAGPGAARATAAGWGAYQDGAALVEAVAAGRAARAAWSALPGEDWPARLAELARSAQLSGRGALLLVPDARDLARVESALATLLPTDQFLTLSAEHGPAERYRRFLAVSRGQVRIVAGTRAAAFAPVDRLAVIAVFDDGDDLFAEPRAPYPHVREVALLRSVQQAAALVIGGFARTAEAQLLIESRWARPVTAARTTVRAHMPHIEAAGDDYAVGADSAAARARLTPAAFTAARRALDAAAPVLVQVPRGGYLPSLACADCGRPARCRRCSGPLAVPRGARTPACRWCAVAVPRWVCSACACPRLKSTVTGAARTAEEIGRAFPGTRLVTSSGGSVQAHIGGGPAIVVATPGAEPVADGGYGAALLLDGGLLLSRPDLRAAEETVRRWMAAATLVRPAAAGGRVVIGADVALPAVQALVRWDPAGHAQAELAARRELGFPPAVAMASIDGDESAVGAALAALDLPDSAAVLGPVPLWSRARETRSGGPGDEDPEAGPRTDGELVRALIRVPFAGRKALVAALRVLAAARSARKDSAPLRIEVDPAELG